MNRLSFIAVCISAGCLVHSPVLAQTHLRIGTYDSRAVAIAFYNSADGRAALDELLSAGHDPEAMKNPEVAAELKRKARAHQVLNHLQGFSVGSVTEILSKYRTDIAGIAQAEHMQAIVSEFEVVHRDPAVQTVDVTDKIVALFAPTEQGRKWIDECRKSKPLPLLEVMMIPAED